MPPTSRPHLPAKRSVTINLDATLVAQIETLKVEAQACGMGFSVTEVCAAALAEALPRVQEEVQRRSNILAQTRFTYLGNRADSGQMEAPE